MMTRDEKWQVFFFWPLPDGLPVEEKKVSPILIWSNFGFLTLAWREKKLERADGSVGLITGIV